MENFSVIFSMKQKVAKKSTVVRCCYWSFLQESPKQPHKMNGDRGNLRHSNPSPKLWHALKRFFSISNLWSLLPDWKGSYKRVALEKMSHFDLHVQKFKEIRKSEDSLQTSATS